MATFTTNLNLKKPSQDDFYNVDDFNGNFQKIDEYMGNIKTTPGSGGASMGKEATATYGGAIGNKASTTAGGAIGSGASSEFGGAVGNGAKTTSGAAVGSEAASLGGGAALGYKTSSGGGAAVGYQAESENGGSIGYQAKSNDGGAVGYDAIAGNGFSGGKNAKVGTEEDGSYTDAIQLGTGINTRPHTLQVYSNLLMDEFGKIPSERLPNNIVIGKVDSYVGTGTYGVNNPTQIPCPFKPKILTIFADNYGSGKSFSGDVFKPEYTTIQTDSVSNGSSTTYQLMHIKYSNGIISIWCEGYQANSKTQFNSSKQYTYQVFE